MILLFYFILFVPLSHQIWWAFVESMVFFPLLLTGEMLSDYQNTSCGDVVCMCLHCSQSSSSCRGTAQRRNRPAQLKAFFQSKGGRGPAAGPQLLLHHHVSEHRGAGERWEYGHTITQYLCKEAKWQWHRTSVRCFQVWICSLCLGVYLY